MNSFPRNTSDISDSDDNIDIPSFKHQAPKPNSASRPHQSAQRRKAGYDYDDNVIAVKKVSQKPSKLSEALDRTPASKAKKVPDAASKLPQAAPQSKKIRPEQSSNVGIPPQAKQATNQKLRAPESKAAKTTDRKASSEKSQTRGITAGLVVRRTLLCLLTALILTVGSLYALLFAIARGPSPTIRDKLVLSALQASATKWVPGLFLDQETVDAIWDASQEVTVDIIPSGDYGSTGDDSNNPTEDEWANALDGMIYKTINGPTYKAYVLLIRDPSRIYVATSCDFSQENRYGLRIFDIADREGAVAVINAGEYVDNGFSLGDTPIGLTYSKGNMVWNDNIPRTFIGFNDENKLIVKNSITYAEAESLGIRDAVSFQWGNLLIEQDGDNIKLHYADGNTGAAQRTAIGQRADGTVIMVVTDGRTASSIGATHNDIIDIMVSYGAVSAGMLDGGSSAMMYYRDWYTKYKVDTSALDQYQLKGIVNRYKAFTNPRTMPTFFAVSPQN